MIFTATHKFAEAHGEISARSNVIVMADEAHRSEYGFVARFAKVGEAIGPLPSGGE